MCHRIVSVSIDKFPKLQSLSESNLKDLFKMCEVKEYLRVPSSTIDLSNGGLMMNGKIQLKDDNRGTQD